MKKMLSLIVAIALMLGLVGISLLRNNNNEPQIKENLTYYSKDDVALYIHTYNKLPSNYITKNEAIKKGWDSQKGNLWEVTDKLCIGGDIFYAYDVDLPKDKNRKYYECDVNYNGGFRNGERLIYSNDGLIYYTNDHYKTFVLLYGEKK